MPDGQTTATPHPSGIPLNWKSFVVQAAIVAIAVVVCRPSWLAFPFEGRSVPCPAEVGFEWRFARYCQGLPISGLTQIHFVQGGC